MLSDSPACIRKHSQLMDEIEESVPLEKADMARLIFQD